MQLPRYYPILDTATLERLGVPLAGAAEEILSGGARILQFRHKGHFSRQMFAEAQTIARLSHAAGAIMIINDRADVAAMLDAGVHLGQDDLPPEEARRVIGAGRFLGFSTHNAFQLAAARAVPADYIALGPIFRTGSKEKPDPEIGLERFKEWRRITERPLVAIGGITRENARSVLEAGADAVAVIGDALCHLHELRRRTEEWLKIVG